MSQDLLRGSTFWSQKQQYKGHTPHVYREGADDLPWGGLEINRGYVPLPFRVRTPTKVAFFLRWAHQPTDASECGTEFSLLRDSLELVEPRKVSDKEEILLCVSVRRALETAEVRRRAHRDNYGSLPYCYGEGLCNFFDGSSLELCHYAMPYRPTPPHVTHRGFAYRGVLSFHGCVDIIESLLLGHFTYSRPKTPLTPTLVHLLVCFSSVAPERGFPNLVWTPCYFGKRWDYREPVLRYKEVALFGQVDDYLDNTIRYDGPRVLWWIADEEERFELELDNVEYTYDAMYSDYPKDEAYEEELWGFAIAIRANLLDSRGFSFIQHPPKISISTRLGQESYKDIAVRDANPGWPIHSTIPVAFSLLRYGFWRDLFMRYGFFHPAKTPLYPTETPRWGCEPRRYIKDIPFFDFIGFEQLGNFESTLPLHILLDPDFEAKFPHTYVFGDLSQQVAWHILPRELPSDVRTFGWSIVAANEGDIEEGFLPDARDVVLLEDAPLILPHAGSGFFIGDSMYFWAWLVWYKAAYSALYFDHLVLDPNIKLEPHEDYLDIFKKIKLLPGRWLNFVFLEGILMDECPWYSWSESWMANVISQEYTLGMGLEYYVEGDMVEFPVFKRPTYTLVELARPWPAFVGEHKEFVTDYCANDIDGYFMSSV